MTVTVRFPFVAPTTPGLPAGRRCARSDRLGAMSLPPDRGHLRTEHRHEGSMGLDALDTASCVELLAGKDVFVAEVDRCRIGAAVVSDSQRPRHRAFQDRSSVRQQLVGVKSVAPRELDTPTGRCTSANQETGSGPSA